jgi:hypothetical protein
MLDNYITGFQDLKRQKKYTDGTSLLGLDFGKYLISSEKRRATMESDNTTGTESDTSDWDLANAGLTSEYSEDSDEYGIYYGEENMYDTAIGGRQQLPFYPKFTGNTQTDRQANLQMRRILNQMNVSAADSGYGGSNVLYPIHETGFTTTDNDSFDDNSDETLSNHSSPVHTSNPVYGRYHKFPSEDDENENFSINSSVGSLDHLMLHRLPGENLGMILGIEGGKDGKGTVTSVAVKSVTLGGAAYRATGSSKGVCVGDEIVTVNNLDLHTLSHDECIQVFKDMPLRVILGIRRGQKDLPAYSVSPLPMQDRIETPHKPVNSPKFANSAKANQPVEITRRREVSDSEDDGFSGFAVYQVVVEKDPSENLGISIVPSYGSTKEYYQVRSLVLYYKCQSFLENSGHSQLDVHLQYTCLEYTCTSNTMCLKYTCTLSTHAAQVHKMYFTYSYASNIHAPQSHKP